MDRYSTTHPVDLGQIAVHMPWAQVFEDLKYPMPYPEVVMAGELAYAQFTQMNSLLMMLAWEGDSKATYSLELLSDSTAAAPMPELYHLTVTVQLDGFNEGWNALGISEEALLDYLKQAVACWAMKHRWANQTVRSTRINAESWTIMV